MVGQAHEGPPEAPASGGPVCALERRPIMSFAASRFRFLALAPVVLAVAAIPSGALAAAPPAQSR
jgi:hypothetical protein